MRAATTADGHATRRRVAAVWPHGSAYGILVSLAPALVLFVFAYGIPMITLLVTSFADWSFLGLDWVGLENYRRLLADSRFWRAVINTAVYCGGTLLVQLPLGVLAGILISWRLPGWRTYRAVLFLPIVISEAAFALTYSTFYNPNFGLLNKALGMFGLPESHDWLFDINTAMFAVMATYVFVVGFGMVLVMAEIASIPQDLYEAAEMDGASHFQRERYITLPAIRAVIGTTALLGILGTIKLFDVVYIMTAGGPADRTATIGTYTYAQYVNDQWGYANALGIVTLILGAVAIIAVRRFFRIGAVGE
jgi:raffinose/stachyose/melibiose transport system permease protein